MITDSMDRCGHCDAMYEVGAGHRCPTDESWLTKNLRDPEFAAAYQIECDKDFAYETARRDVIDAVRKWKSVRHRPHTLDEEMQANCTLDEAGSVLDDLEKKL